MAEVTAQSPKLVLKYQGMVIKECLLTTPEFTIGRKADNDLVVEDAAVSGRHARIAKIQSVYFIEDLESTNGTLVNGDRIDRKQLRDADVVSIGKHRLVFSEEVRTAVANLPAASESGDRTVFLKSGNQGSKPHNGHQIGVLKIVSGRTDFTVYRLTQQVTIIGARPDAFIKLAGFFAPKTAAMIGRRGDAYYVTAPNGTKKVRVNDVVVEGKADLKDGDLLEVSGVKMYFTLKEAA